MLLLFLGGCVDPLPVVNVSSEPALVVDGMITDQPGPYTVRLFMSSGPSADVGHPEMVRAASVWILDENERAYKMTETAPGVYASDPSELLGQTGGTYSLRFVLEDGSEYLSDKETLLPAGVIDSVYAVYSENAINQTDRALPQDAISFFVDGSSDAANTQGLQRWRSTAIYEILTFPESRVRIIDGQTIPDPVPCSGYVYSQGQLQSVDTCSCCNCWVYDYPRNVVVSPAKVVARNHYKSVNVAQAPVDRWRFFRKYYLEVEQLSVSEKVYEFWKRVQAQQQGAKNLFQPNAVKVQGNIRCVNEPRKEVFGIFSASAITRKSMFLTRGQLPKAIGPPEKVTADCRYIMENTVNVKPPFW
jgi:hypothetical protein